MNLNPALIPYAPYLLALTSQKPLMMAALDYLWKNPETGYKEWKSHKYLADAYEALGYTLTPAGNIPGFIADLDTGRPGPRVLILSELDSIICPAHPDADPETGAVHSCGHHAQGAALLGVAAAMKAPGALDGLCGSIRFAVVPAEELLELEYREGLRKQGTIRYFGGKPEFLARGLFDGCDLAFMIHSGGGEHSFSVSEGANGCIAKTMTFEGKASHAGGSPHQGINALYAASLGMNAINALRETFRDDEHIRVHPIVTNGGVMVNAIPGETGMESYVRGASYDAIVRENTKVNRALAGAALSIGGNVVLEDRPGYMPVDNDRTLSHVFAEAARLLVPEQAVRERVGWDTGCTDMGDLSVVMPAIHPHGSGACGLSHGADYRIANPDCAVVESAKCQLLMLRMLLENGAAKAKEVVANANPKFRSFEEYFAAQDALILNCRAVEYGEDGSAVVRWK